MNDLQSTQTTACACRSFVFFSLRARIRVSKRDLHAHVTHVAGHRGSEVCMCST